MPDRSCFARERLSKSTETGNRHVSIESDDKSIAATRTKQNRFSKTVVNSRMTPNPNELTSTVGSKMLGLRTAK